MFWHFPHYNNQGGRPAGAVRDGDWKLVEYYDTGKAELYDLASDIGEAHDLADTERQRVLKCATSLPAGGAKSAQENGPNPNFDPALFKRLYEDFDPSRPPLAATAAQMAEQMKSWRELMNEVVRKK